MHGVDSRDGMHILSSVDDTFCTISSPNIDWIAITSSSWTFSIMLHRFAVGRSTFDQWLYDYDLGIVLSLQPLRMSWALTFGLVFALPAEMQPSCSQLLILQSRCSGFLTFASLRSLLPSLRPCLPAPPSNLSDLPNLQLLNHVQDCLRHPQPSFSRYL